MMPIMIDGSRYIAPIGTQGRMAPRARFICRYCGNTFDANVYSVNAGGQRSCGCQKGLYIHGMSESTTYRIWWGMMQRCYNPKKSEFKNYGRRGIKVCERWHSFVNFLDDMGERPHGLDIERKENDGPYEPENCRWASRSDNLQNKRTTNRTGFRGVARRRYGWTATITRDRVEHYIGIFRSAEEAALAYNSAAYRLYGPTANLNKVDES